jgi:hypothetical protein
MSMSWRMIRGLCGAPDSGGEVSDFGKGEIHFFRCTCVRLDWTDEENVVNVWLNKVRISQKAE